MVFVKMPRRLHLFSVSKAESTFISTTLRRQGIILSLPALFRCCVFLNLQVACLLFCLAHLYDFHVDCVQVHWRRQLWGTGARAP